MFREFISDYQNLSLLLKEYSYQDILQRASEELGIKPSDLEEFPMGGYSKGKLSGAYKYVLQDLIKNIGYYDWLYEKLEDETSIRVFTNLMQYRILPDMAYIRQAFDADNHQYFDGDIVVCDENEVFVDCGGFIGDTTEAFIAQYRKYKKIYVYEPSGDNILSCKKNLEKYPGIEIRNCGVGEKHAVMSISNSGSSSSFMGEGEDGNRIEIVSLDEDIREKVTFIKMDVEGFEIPAMIGAKNHIKNDSPKLAICTYHIISDMWEIPKLLYYINPNYKFYIRHYMETQNWETVLYAIPEERPMEKADNGSNHTGRKKVVAMAPYNRGWSNVELVKDCGLIPYLLYKNHGCDAVMVGAGGGDYPYLETYVRGMKMEFLANGSEEEKLRYITENAAGIDCLLIRGCYPSNFHIVRQYKRLNPEGRIYVGLDANSAWMDRIIWDDRNFVSFMDCCDVIATSGRAMQEHLNRKWPWKIEHIANGYYNFRNRDSIPVLENKRNVIFTAGRIGAEQKATNILLEAFAMIAGEIPDWRLRLAGNIEEGFEPYLEQYFKCFPELKERVQFSGLVQDREMLWKEYLEAKIFALPSLCEGGTPNVVAEALNAGCVMAVSRIDAYDEMINGGACGMSAEINDIQGFGQILLQLCKDKNLPEMAKNAYEYGRNHFDMERIVARLDEMLFGGR